MSHAQKPTSPIHFYTQIQAGAPSCSIPWPGAQPDSASSLPARASKEPVLWSCLPALLILRGTAAEGTGCLLPAEGDVAPFCWATGKGRSPGGRESTNRKPLVQATDVQSQRPRLPPHHTSLACFLLHVFPWMFGRYLQRRGKLHHLS